MKVCPPVKRSPYPVRRGLSDEGYQMAQLIWAHFDRQRARKTEAQRVRMAVTQLKHLILNDPLNALYTDSDLVLKLDNGQKYLYILSLIKGIVSCSDVGCFVTHCQAFLRLVFTVITLPQPGMGFEQREGFCTHEILRSLFCGQSSRGSTCDLSMVEKFFSLNRKKGDDRIFYQLKHVEAVILNPTTINELCQITGALSASLSGAANFRFINEQAFLVIDYNTKFSDGAFNRVYIMPKRTFYPGRYCIVIEDKLHPLLIKKTLSGIVYREPIGSRQAANLLIKELISDPKSQQYLILPFVSNHLECRLNLFPRADCDLWHFVEYGYNGARGKQVAGFNQFCFTMMRQLIVALLFLHEDKKMVHRDIKPGNILLNMTVDGKPHLKIGDLDTLCKVGQEYDAKAICTPHFEHPGSRTSSQFSHDVFSFAITSWTLLGYTFANLQGDVTKTYTPPGPISRQDQQIKSTHREIVNVLHQMTCLKNPTESKFVRPTSEWRDSVYEVTDRYIKNHLS
jgi:hypothetical protein